MSNFIDIFISQGAWTIVEQQIVIRQLHLEYLQIYFCLLPGQVGVSWPRIGFLSCSPFFAVGSSYSSTGFWFPTMKMRSLFFLFDGLFVWFLGLHMEVPRLGVESELQLPIYDTAIAIRDPSCLCNLHHSSQQ